MLHHDISKFSKIFKDFIKSYHGSKMHPIRFGEFNFNYCKEKTGIVGSNSMKLNSYGTWNFPLKHSISNFSMNRMNNRRNFFCSSSHVGVESEISGICKLATFQNGTRHLPMPMRSYFQKSSLSKIENCSPNSLNVEGKNGTLNKKCFHTLAQQNYRGNEVIDIGIAKGIAKKSIGMKKNATQCKENCSNVCCCCSATKLNTSTIPMNHLSRSYRQRTNTQILEICKGHKHFRDVTYPLKEQIYSDLILNGQKPKALFISCSDSRIIPDDLLNLQPGDLFVTRNVGAFVPPYQSLLDGYHSVGAVIEYAVNFLNVTDVIVCGHSHCGACAALFSPEFQKPKEEMKPEEYQKVIHLRNWLKLGAETKEIVKERNIEDPILRQELTSRVSVVLQLSNLLTYPYIREKTDIGKLTLHGWYYDIEKGIVEYYDSDKKQFFDYLDLERRSKKNGIPSAIEIDTTNPIDFEANSQWLGNDINHGSADSKQS